MSKDSVPLLSSLSLSLSLEMSLHPILGFLPFNPLFSHEFNGISSLRGLLFLEAAKGCRQLLRRKLRKLEGTKSSLSRNVNRGS